MIRRSRVDFLVLVTGGDHRTEQILLVLCEVFSPFGEYCLELAMGLGLVEAGESLTEKLI